MNNQPTNMNNTDPVMYAMLCKWYSPNMYECSACCCRIVVAVPQQTSSCKFHWWGLPSESAGKPPLTMFHQFPSPNGRHIHPLQHVHDLGSPSPRPSCYIWMVPTPTQLPWIVVVPPPSGPAKQLIRYNTLNPFTSQPYWLEIILF